MTEQEKRREYFRRRHEEALPACHALMSCYPFTLDDLPGEECHVSNLVWSTSAENSQHAAKTGLIKSGEESYQAGVTNDQAKYIRENPDNLSGKEPAVMFGVDPVTISYIQTGKTYADAGGTVRRPQKHGEYNRIPDEERAQIKADWATGKYSFRALGRKFGHSYFTISKIIREDQASSSPENVTDEPLQIATE